MARRRRRMRRVSRPTEKPAVRPRRMAKESWGLGVSVGLLGEGRGDGWRRCGGGWVCGNSHR